MKQDFPPVYVIHALSGYEFHEKRLRKLLDSFELEGIWVTEGDVSLFNDHVLAAHFEVEKIAQKRISKGAISCTLNHFYAYEKIAAGEEWAIVLENDPCFLGDFVQKISALRAEIHALPPNFIISLENTTLKFPSFWDTKPNQHLYPAKVGRMAGAYIIDKAAAATILEDLQSNKCTEIIDWWHNDLIKRGKLKMYWAHPALVEQGSHNGTLHAGISTKEKSLLRKWRWKFNKLYKMTFRRLLPQNRIISSLRNN